MKTKLLPVFLFLMVTSTQLLARPSLGALDQKLDRLMNALVACPSNAPTRFVDNGDGTFCDHQTGLMWERKNTLSDGAQNFDNPRDVDNTYSLASDFQITALDGTAFTDFLARLNGELASVGNPAQQFAGYNDWRLPTSTELMTISNCSFVGTCSGGITTVANPVLGPIRLGSYWSSTTSTFRADYALAFDYALGAVKDEPKAIIFFVRAVRGGNRPETVAPTPVGPVVPIPPLGPLNPPPPAGPAPTGPLVPLGQ